MERTIEIPNDVQAELQNFKVTIKGPKGSLEKDFYSSLFKKDIAMQKNENKIMISTKSKRRKVKAMIGTMDSIINNMIAGVKEAYTAKLKIVYMHFPFTVKVNGKEVLVNNFLGEKTARKTRVLGDCKVEIQGDEITVTGISKEDVGQTAAKLEHATWIKKRDRRVFQDGMFITKKP
jgi:large subunit ribosomal protein L6